MGTTRSTRCRIRCANARPRSSMSSCAELAVELVVELAVEPRVQVFLSVSVCAGCAMGWLGLAGVLGTWVWRMAYGAGGGRLWWERGPAVYVQVLQIVAGARLKCLSFVWCYLIYT